MNITIIIPTCDRPDMLRDALFSITRQTALSYVEKIIISENGGNRESEKVANAYANEFKLPVVYQFRDPATSAINHARLLWDEHRESCSTELTAILHDDDWWGPHHLGLAIQAMNAQRQASFYGGCQFDVFDIKSLLHVTSNLFAWFASGYPRVDQAWILGERNMLIAQTMGGICHYSTMVVRTEAMKKASTIYDMDNASFDNDRLIQAALSRIGPVLYNPTPHVFIRQHANRDCMANFTREDRIRHFISTTEWIIKTSGANVEGLIREFAAILDQCPKQARNEVVEAMYREWCLPTLSAILKEKP